MSSNRSFGIVFFIVFLLISFYPMLKNENISTWALIISLVFLILGLTKSRVLSPFNRLWFEFGLLLGKILSPLIMGTIFFVVVTPIGLLMRLFNKDLLNLKLNKKKSFWIKKDEQESKMKNQF